MASSSSAAAVMHQEARHIQDARRVRNPHEILDFRTFAGMYFPQDQDAVKVAKAYRDYLHTAATEGLKLPQGELRSELQGLMAAFDAVIQSVPTFRNQAERQEVFRQARGSLETVHTALTGYQVSEDDLMVGIPMDPHQAKHYATKKRSGGTWGHFDLTWKQIHDLARRATARCAREYYAGRITSGDFLVDFGGDVIGSKGETCARVQVDPDGSVHCYPVDDAQFRTASSGSKALPVVRMRRNELQDTAPEREPFSMKR